MFGFFVLFCYLFCFLTLVQNCFENANVRMSPENIFYPLCFLNNHFDSHITVSESYMKCDKNHVRVLTLGIRSCVEFHDVAFTNEGGGGEGGRTYPPFKILPTHTV